ncbi:hypothetical protein KIW84_062644 [Lathyrus oleraceus]|uniref:CCHC-type domain-containing protein n=1 Tax=Pisum sativum TaxID=3888 RepID=A0A9D4W8Y8_PEA|nr:hypothetical protein KIW84_062644 [Pisum sativum]
MSSAAEKHFPGRHQNGNHFFCTAAPLTLGQLAGFAAFAARTVAFPASLFGKLPPKCHVETKYAAKFTELSKYYTPYDEATGEFSKCVKFENGLRPEIKQAIGYQRIRVFSDLVDCCRIFEQDTKARAESYQQRVDRKGKNQNDRGKPYAAGKGFQRQSGMKRPSGGDSSAPAKCFRCGQAGHRIHECTSTEKKCYKCGKGGHLAAECRSKTVTCFNCGELGHISPQCPKPKKENQSGGKVFALSGSETSADDRLIRGTLW